MGFLYTIEEQLWAFLDSLYHSVGWLGVIVMMTIESACIPLPSEVIMPLAGGFLVHNWGDLIIAGLAGALGCTIGSTIAYWVGAWGGRPLIERYGKYILIRHHHLVTAERWFGRWGEATAFFARLVPIVRTFISFPAGVARMNFPKFLLYTFLGSFPWSLALAWAGWTWDPRTVREAMRPLDVPIALVILAVIAWFVFRSWRARRADDAAEAAEAAGAKTGRSVAAKRTGSPEVHMAVKPGVPGGPPRRRSSRGYVETSKNGRQPPAAS